jgi:hypothetical protein
VGEGDRKGRGRVGEGDGKGRGGEGEEGQRNRRKRKAKMTMRTFWERDKEIQTYRGREIDIYKEAQKEREVGESESLKH